MQGCSTEVPSKGEPWACGDAKDPTLAGHDLWAGATMGSHPQGKDCAGGLLWGGNTAGVRQEQQTWLPFSSPEEVRRSKSVGLGRHSSSSWSKAASLKCFTVSLQNNLSTSHLFKCLQSYQIAKASRKCPLSLQSWSLLAGCDCAGVELKVQAVHLQDCCGRAQQHSSAQPGATGRRSTAQVLCYGQLTAQILGKCRTRAKRSGVTATGPEAAPQTTWLSNSPMLTYKYPKVAAAQAVAAGESYTEA